MTETITRRGRGKAQASLDIIEAAVAILEEIQPASIRACCYRLFVGGHIDSMAKVNTDKVSKLLVWAREQGRLPWEWVVDETREVEQVSTWREPGELINAAVRQYRKDYWEAQPLRVEVLSEKGTVRGTAAPILNCYGIPFRVMHGYGSATSLYGLAQDSLGSTKPLVLLYIGDWDPSGLHMSEVDLPARLNRYGGEARIERLALNYGDVRPSTALPSFEVETKAKDPRCTWFVDHYGLRCWEVDALSPVVLRQRLEQRILSLIDRDAWDHATGIEQAECESMQTFLATWNQSISGQAGKYSAKGGADTDGN